MAAMPTHIRRGRSPCPVARSLDVRGDKWTLLIIREAFTGSTRFMEFSAELPGLARTLLSAQLRRLVELGVSEKVPLSETSLYYDYVLTEMGQRLFPVVTALRQSGADYLSFRRVRAAPLPGRSAHSNPCLAGGGALRRWTAGRAEGHTGRDV
jgi:DNA-binding HxlR family transcriptional regulator